MTATHRLSEKARSGDGTKTVGELAREERVVFDAQPMTVRCAIEECVWSFEGPAGEARERASEHRVGVHGAKKPPMFPMQGFEVDEPEPDVEAVRPLGEGEPDVDEAPAGDRDVDSDAPTGASPAESSPSPSGSTRESIIDEIRVYAAQHNGLAPSSAGTPGNRLWRHARKLGLVYSDLVAQAGASFARGGRPRKPLDAGTPTGGPDVSASSGADDPLSPPAPLAPDDPGGASTSPRPALLLILEGLRDLVDLYYPEPADD